jgi:hypothetical protein
MAFQCRLGAVSEMDGLAQQKLMHRCQLEAEREALCALRLQMA